MRRFIVWANCNHVSGDRDRDINDEILEFEDGVADDTIELECVDCLDTMIGNNFDTGYNELSEEEYQEILAKRKRR
jgi:hypothetical protein